MQNNNMIVMLDFLEKAGISTEGMNATFDEENNKLTLKKEERKGGQDNTKQTVIVKLDEQKNSVVIKNEVIEECDFQESNLYDGVYVYRVSDEQTFTKFKVDDENLNVYIATVAQTVRKDTNGDGGFITVIDSDEFSDLLDVNTNDLVTFEGMNISVQKTSYTVPQGYKVTDGVSPITDTISNTK